MVSGIAVRELHEVGEYLQVVRLFGGIWGPDLQPVTIEMMRALAHSGNYVAGAFDGESLVGASVAFLAMPAGRALHSHITGAAGAGRGIGLALKLHQREWALARGIERITWTYDPLVRRNAYFNLVKLGARPEEYLPSFYGPMEDAINAGDETDRMLAVWRLNAPHVAAAARREPYPVVVPRDAVVGLESRDGRPVVGRWDAPVVLVEVPPDITAMRREDPGAAKAWRYALRDTLCGLLGDGARIIGFHNKSYYVVERSQAGVTE
ncbi:GNAT family N-acetyltransferase [Thermopolyspora sp. NPDC052614]|uniref:GNAT family N-acetyltransferase n=1 Tax=Thermopolyspora sp. NPDC052614 TaxID=3155682 RepID=UPI003436EC44